MPVNTFHDPQVAVITSSQIQLVTLKLWHATAGLYLWEFFTSFDHEWKVIRGRLPYRWTIWIYSLARVAALLGVVLCLVVVNTTTPINCQLLYLFSAFFFCVAATSASLLIVLRTIAIWNQNKVVTALVITILGTNIAFHLQSLIRLHSVWDPAHFTCEIVKKDPSLLSFLPAMISDMVLLLIVLAGLFTIRRGGGATFGLAHLVWKQGVLWLVLGCVAEIPPLVLALSHLNDPLHLTFEAPGVIIMTIAATRMQRSLVNFASSDVMHESPKVGSSFAIQKVKWTGTPSTAEDQVEVAVHKSLEQHSTGSTNDSDSCTITTRSTWRPITVSPFPSIPEAQSV